MKDWEGDEAPAVGMAVKCRVVHATGLQGTGSVCVMCVSCFCVFLHIMCIICVCMRVSCMCYVCVCVCVVSPLCGSFLGSALAQGASMCNDVGL